MGGQWGGGEERGGCRVNGMIEVPRSTTVKQVIPVAVAAALMTHVTPAVTQPTVSMCLSSCFL